MNCSPTALLNMMRAFVPSLGIVLYVSSITIWMRTPCGTTFRLPTRPTVTPR